MKTYCRKVLTFVWTRQKKTSERAHTRTHACAYTHATLSGVHEWGTAASPDRCAQMPVGIGGVGLLPYQSEVINQIQKICQSRPAPL